MSLPDDKVEESAMVKERGSDVKREVDLLLERQIFGTNLRIVIECRSRGEKDDIKWIDSLIGKYRDLDIHKVVPVSRSGFSPAVTEKAAVNRINTLTLEQTLETNWPTEFTRLSIGSWFRSDKPQSVMVVTEPPLPFPLSLQAMVFTTTVQEIATIERVAQTIYQRRQKDLNQAIAEKLLEFFKTVHDLNTKSIISEITEKPAFPSFIKGEDQQEFRIESFTVSNSIIIFG